MKKNILFSAKIQDRVLGTKYLFSLKHDYYSFRLLLTLTYFNKTLILI